MDHVALVGVHQSQFPSRYARGLADGFHARAIPHKYHYDTPKQALKWVALHGKYSPYASDPACRELYRAAARAAAARVQPNIAHVVGVGCGSGLKDLHVVEELRALGRGVVYTPCDVSAAMTLVALENAAELFRGLQVSPLVFDLPACGTLPALLKPMEPVGSARVMTFYGMLPNFEPGRALPALVRAVRAGDWILVGANLCSEEALAADLAPILPQYDNPETLDWLFTILSDVGVRREDGAFTCAVRSEGGAAALRRIEIFFNFSRRVELALPGSPAAMEAGDSLRLFFSYRHTLRQAADLLASHGLATVEHWVSPAGDEGIFLCQRAGQGK